MAAKYEELLTPRITRFVDACDGLYHKRDIIEMEGEILEAVGFNLGKIVGLR